jgi:hypothetical protein
LAADHGVYQTISVTLNRIGEWKRNT